MNEPDGSMPDVGVNFLYDGATGAILNTYHHPEPQAGAIFGMGSAACRPATLAATPRADLYTPGGRPERQVQGPGPRLRHDRRPSAFSSTLSFALLDDPTPAPAGNFGAGYAALGNLVDQTGKVRNELLVGAGTSGQPGNPELVNDIHIFDPLKSEVLQSIADPDAEPGKPLRRRSRDARRPQRRRVGSTSWRRRSRGTARPGSRHRAASTSCAATTRSRCRRRPLATATATGGGAA